MSKIALYNTHYEAYTEMLGKPNIHSIFEHIMDTYLMNIWAGKSGPIVISFNEIARKRHVSKNTVPEIIKLLEVTRIIKCNRDESKYNNSISFSIDTDRFVSLICTFIALKNDEKKKFTSALFNSDEITLEALGYHLIKDAGKRLYELKGNSNFLDNIVSPGAIQDAKQCGFTLTNK
jgi:hypothetical protein